MHSLPPGYAAIATQADPEATTVSIHFAKDPVGHQWQFLVAADSAQWEAFIDSGPVFARVDAVRMITYRMAEEA